MSAQEKTDRTSLINCALDEAAASELSLALLDKHLTIVQSKFEQSLDLITQLRSQLEAEEEKILKLIKLKIILKEAIKRHKRPNSGD